MIVSPQTINNESVDEINNEPELLSNKPELSVIHSVSEITIDNDPFACVPEVT